MFVFSSFLTTMEYKDTDTYGILACSYTDSTYQIRINSSLIVVLSEKMVHN